MMKIYSGVYNRKGKDMNHWLSIIFRVLLPLVFIFISLTVFASSHSNVMNVPEKIIKGVVVDSLSGNPLPGVTIQIKGTSSGTTTNGKGAFQLSVSDEAVLVVSYLGYNEKKILVNGQTDIKISLSSSATSLDQVVVIGYGSVKKKDVTGAVSKIGSEKIEKRPMKNAVQAMQGQIAGVDVSSSQRPGEVGDITIRGVRSLTASNEPLYVVDGIPLTTGGIEYLNPNDIESISVLKDASATAIYGSRGANGVVLVTTKGGEKGRFKVNYSGSVSFLKMHNLATLMNASQSIDYRRWAFYYSNPNLYPRGDEPTKKSDYQIFNGSGDPATWANIERGWSSGKWDGSKVKTTCWTCLVTQPGISTQHTLSVSGGSEKMKGYASFGYLNNKGTSKGQAYKRYTGNARLSFTPTKWFTFGANINASYSKQNYGQSNTGRQTITSSGDIFHSAEIIYTYTVPFDSAGNRILYPGGDQAVKTVMNEWKYSTDQRVAFRAFGSFNAQLDFGSIVPVLKGLSYRMNFGPDFSIHRDGVYIDGKSAIRNGTSYASLSKNLAISYTLDNLIYYNRTFGKNDFHLTLLQTQTKYHTEGSDISADDIPFA
ncbi:MAG TPA: SusC/RagA family TonB-linked outer membrane protein, partial [Chitinophagaceae bacterium]|nr:SusC/RagA family TonB-linked outer membrane protein [Chitinophagaceae bacterium]